MASATALPCLRFAPNFTSRHIAAALPCAAPESDASLPAKAKPNFTAPYHWTRPRKRPCMQLVSQLAKALSFHAHLHMSAALDMRHPLGQHSKS